MPWFNKIGRVETGREGDRREFRGLPAATSVVLGVRSDEPGLDLAGLEVRISVEIEVTNDFLIITFAEYPLYLCFNS